MARHYGPAGRNGTVTSNLALSSAHLQKLMRKADLTADQGLADAVSLVAEAVAVKRPRPNKSRLLVADVALAA